jgi:hypothetical protein
LLRPDVRARIRFREYAADRYAQALAEVPRLAGESAEDRRIRVPSTRPSVQPSSTSPVAFLLDVNRWLERSGVTIR